MINLIKAELIKLHKKKLFTMGIIIAFIPFIISYFFTVPNDFLKLYGKYGLIQYVNGMFTTIIISTGFTMLYFSILINSLISDELKSDSIIYELVGVNKRRTIFTSKLFTLFLIGFIFTLLSLLSASLGFSLFIKPTHFGGGVSESTELPTLCFSILYFLIFILILGILAFIGLAKSLIFASVTVIILTVNLSDVKAVTNYVLGSPLFYSQGFKMPELRRLIMNQSIVLFFLLAVFSYIGFTNFRDRDF